MVLVYLGSVDFDRALSHKVQIRSSDWYSEFDNSSRHTLRASSQSSDASSDSISIDRMSWGSLFPRRDPKFIVLPSKNLTASREWPVAIKTCTSNAISSGSDMALDEEETWFCYSVRFCDLQNWTQPTSSFVIPSAAFDIMRYARVPNSMRSFSGRSSCLLIRKHI
jgi:hypothetical protein